MKNGYTEEAEFDACFANLGVQDKPWQIQMDVYLEDDQSDPPKFRIECPLPIKEVKPGETYVVFQNKCRPGFDILFHLHDETHKGYTFPKHADEAVWSKIGTTCPDERWGKNEVLSPKRVLPDGLTLVVNNNNDKKEDGSPIGLFRYTLNVGLNGEKPYLQLDPGGDDQNGMRSFTLTR